MIRISCSGAWNPGLNDAECDLLFDIAEDTLAWCVARKSSEFDYSGYAVTDLFRIPFATFVTLTIRGKLRGCIGSLLPDDMLYLGVHQNAVNAALRDPRFAPVKEQELPSIDIHISILSPIEAISSIDAFLLGEHGIIMEKDGHRAVYLPEVSVEQGWTVEETLSSLSQKAGLSGNAWRSNASFSVFSSVVLSKSSLT